MIKRKRVLTYFFILFNLAVSVTCADVLDIKYGEDKNQSFDFYEPYQSADTLLIFVHGGGWVLGNKNKYGDITRYFSRRGFCAVNMNYRLAPKWKYDAPLQDIASVLKMIDSQRERFKLNPGYKIALMGHSAGAHLVTLFALKESEYGVNDVNYAIGIAGPYDLEAGSNPPRRRKLMKAFLGDTPRAEASPVKQIKAGDRTKFMLIAGDRDNLVSISEIYKFAQALNIKGVYVEQLVVAGRDHGTILSGIPSGDEVARKIVLFLNEDR